MPGNSYYTAQEVQDAAGIVEGDNLFFINRFRVVSGIFARLPYIEDVSIKRYLPNKVVLTVNECKALGYVSVEGEAWVIDRSCRILTKASEEEREALDVYKRQVFMGDTGSLFLGGAIVALAFAYDMPLILIVLGLMYIIETLSDIIQVGYFKLSHGKRVFKMAPFHHHLEMGGWTGKKWTERELFLLYFSISLVCAVISFVGVYSRYAF